MCLYKEKAFSRDEKMIIRVWPRSYIVSNLNEVVFDFEVDGASIVPQTISVLPKSINSTASIYDSKNDIWVNQGSPWSNAPGIYKPLKIKIHGIYDKTELRFLFQNKDDGKIYETENIVIYGRKDLSKYTGKVNKNILAFETTRSETKIERQDSGFFENEINVDNFSTAKARHKKYLAMYLVIFLISAFAGFMIRRHRSKCSKIA